MHVTNIYIYLTFACELPALQSGFIMMLNGEPSYASFYTLRFACPQNKRVLPIHKDEQEKI